MNITCFGCVKDLPPEDHWEGCKEAEATAMALEARWSRIFAQGPRASTERA